MPFETNSAAVKRIAVIGGGISGLGAAHGLSKSARVTLFEAAPRLGGHARTVLAGRSGSQPVDTGFIVFNHANYPHFANLLDMLDVPIAKSEMTFAVSADGGAFEYAIRDLNSLFAQRRNIVRPAFLRMLRDIVKFNARASSMVSDPSLTIGDLIERLNLSDWFRDHYLLPFSGAIWSTPKEKVLDFPARAMVRFFENHALMSHKGQHQWYTVEGGSRVYVERLAARLTRTGVDLRTNASVAAVDRFPGGVRVRCHGGAWEIFDEVVFATHGDVSLKLLADPSPEERAALGLVRYQPNEAILHADTRMMPRRKACWSAWNYTEGKGERPERIALTYWMNALQPIPESDPLFVTLNTGREIPEHLIYDSETFRHPVYDHDMLRAQEGVRVLGGAQNTWFCGAWMRSGFHEDGLASALDVVDAMHRRSPARIAAE